MANEGQTNNPPLTALQLQLLLCVPLINHEAAAMDFGRAVYIDDDGGVKLATNAGTEEQAQVDGLVMQAGIGAGLPVLIYAVRGQKVIGLPATLLCPGYAFLGVSGLLTSAPLDPTDPANGGKFSTQVGRTLSTSSVLFSPRQPIGL